MLATLGLALPDGWDQVRTSSGEILFLHQDSLQCQRERPRDQRRDQRRELQEQQEELTKEITLDRMACKFSDDNSVTAGEQAPAVQFVVKIPNSGQFS